MARTKPRKSRPSASSSTTETDRTYLVLYNSKDKECPRLPIIASSELLKFHAFRWSYLIRNRNRWSYNNSNQATELVGDATDLLHWLLGQTDKPGGTPRQTPLNGPDSLQRLASAEMIEVSIPFKDEPTGWEYRILPWEYVLSAATQDNRRAKSFFIVRHLRRSGPVVGGTSASGFLHIESAPASTRQDYDFASERTLARQLAGLSGSTVDDSKYRLEDPTLEDIGNRVREAPPRTIHLSGFDSWLAAAELKNASFAQLHQDGYLVRKSDGLGWEIAKAEDLAERLVYPPSRPRLITFNIYNSGTRLAAMCVAKGAAAAIGYQDTFDPRLGEQFFAAFNRACTATQWDIAGSARYAWDQLKESKEPLTGSGMIVWMDESITVRRPASLRALEAKVETRFRRKLPPERIRDVLDLEIAPKDRMNYSTLHNNGSLFDCFIVRRKPGFEGEVSDIHVSVKLQIGPDSYPFETNVTLSVHQTAIDLARDIVISLTSDLARAVRNQIQTTLFVEVSYGEHVLHNRTSRILLLPVDEWVDSDSGRRWLPSFVLPGDPAVRQIIDTAQKYLIALEDDFGAGFDGYQGVNADDLEKKGSDPAVVCETVDLQVRAIWSALLVDAPLAYINPPPTFTDKSQRVRTPSDTISGRRGTCIDLALLLAACLEYVDIYPAIVLLAGHAFPAYWRHSDYLDRFMSGQDVRLPARDDDLDPEYVSALLGTSGRWSLGKGHYKHILQAIEDGKLVPIETVMLTTRNGFTDAVDEGRRNFLGADDFDSLIDINRARTDPVQPITPLPIRREES